MNKLEGVISNIESAGNIALISINVSNDIFSALIITLDDYIKLDNKISLLFKETETTISIEKPEKISISNIFPSIITKIEKGIILSKVYLEYKDSIVISIITTKVLESMKLEINTKVYFLIKASEVILMKNS